MKITSVLLLGAALLIAAPAIAQTDQTCLTRETVAIENPNTAEGLVYTNPSDVAVIKRILVELGVPAETITATMFVVYVNEDNPFTVVLAGFTAEGCLEGGVAMPMPVFEAIIWQEIERSRS